MACVCVLMWVCFVSVYIYAVSTFYDRPPYTIAFSFIYQIVMRVWTLNPIQFSLIAMCLCVPMCTYSLPFFMQSRRYSKYMSEWDAEKKQEENKWTENTKKKHEKRNIQQYNAKRNGNETKQTIFNRIFAQRKCNGKQFAQIFGLWSWLIKVTKLLPNFPNLFAWKLPRLHHRPLHFLWFELFCWIPQQFVSSLFSKSM